jgi:hypothetical protein
MSILNILVGKIDLLYVFTCLYNYIDIVLCTVYFVFVLTFTHPGLYWIYGNKDDDDEVSSGGGLECLRSGLASREGRQGGTRCPGV